MGIVITALKNKSIERMEYHLKKASRGLVPIEIDGIVYFIPISVQELIDSLHALSSLSYKRK